MQRSVHFIGVLCFCVLSTAMGGMDMRETIVRRLIGTGRYQEGFERTVTIVEGSSDRRMFYALLAETGQYAGRVREADSILTLCARRGWDVPEALTAMGWLDAHRARWLDAYTHYQSSVQLGGSSVVAFAGIQEMHEKLHGREAAISHLLALSHARDRTAAVWYALALAYWSQWDLTQALSAVERSLRNGSTDPRVVYLLHAIRCSRDPGMTQRSRLAATYRTAEAQGDREGMAFLTWVRMNAYDGAGYADSAETSRLEGLRLAREFGLIGWMGQFLLQGGRDAFSRGEIAAALDAADSAATCFCLAGEYDGILAAYSLRMSILLESFRYAEALDYCFRMLQQIDDRSDPRLHAGAAIDAAWILSRIGGQRIALVLGIHAESILEKMLYAVHDRCRLNSTLAVVHASLGDTVLAGHYAATAARIANSAGGTEELQANCEGVLGDLASGRGERAAARKHYLRQWRLADRASNLGERKSAAHALGSLAILEDRRAEALRWADTALALARLTDDAFMMGKSHVIRARVAERAGDCDAARTSQRQLRASLGALRRLRLVCSLTREMREWYLEQHAATARALIESGDVVSAAGLMSQAREDMSAPEIPIRAPGSPEAGTAHIGVGRDRRALSAMIHRWIFSGLIEDVAYSDTAIRALGSFFDTTVLRVLKEDERAALAEHPVEAEGAIAYTLRHAVGKEEIGIDLLFGQERTEVIVITSDTIAHCRLPAGPSELRTLADGLAGSTALSGPGVPQKLSQADCRQVFAPLFSLLSQIAGARTEIVIIGSGMQSRIPFEVLRWDDGHDRGVWVDRFAVSYRPYLALRSREFAAMPSAADRVLIVGDPEIGVRAERSAEAVLDPERQGNVSGLVALPGALKEIAILKDLYGPQLDILRGEDATRENFCSIASRYGIVHIATHGAARNASQNQHVLFLSSSSGMDGTLKMEDILTLDLRASLVVLPACVSAQPSSTGDVESIAEAFLEAGAGSVLAARWDIDDERAGEFLGAFYAEIRSGGSRSMAVRNAMRTMISKGHHAPQLWAGFQLFGEGGAPVGAQERGEGPVGTHLLAWAAIVTVTTIVLWSAWRKIRLGRYLQADRERRE